MGGSSSGKGGGGGKASAASNAAIRSEVKTIATSTSSINQASTKIQRVLDRAPVGTELVFDEYYSRGKLMQSAYTKRILLNGKELGEQVVEKLIQQFVTVLK